MMFAYVHFNVFIYGIHPRRQMAEANKEEAELYILSCSIKKYLHSSNELVIETDDT